jgi:hypothetical protein
MVKQKQLDSHPVWNQLSASVGSGIVLSTIDLESVTLRKCFDMIFLHSPSSEITMHFFIFAIFLFERAA